MNRERILRERLKAAGFDSLDAFLEGRPGAGYVALANELGAPLVAIDLIRSFLTNARERGERAFRAAAIDLLARHLREILTNGWGRLRPNDSPDTDVEIVNISPWSLWSTQVAAADEAHSEHAHAVFQALKALAPAGWLPTDQSDPVLRRAFDTAWPAQD